MTDTSAGGAIAFTMMEQPPVPGRVSASLSGEGAASAGAGPERPDRIIDSFLVVDGLATRLDLHLWRTWRAVERAFGQGEGVPSWRDLDTMLSQGLAIVPAEGEWFPLFEVRYEPESGITVGMQTQRPAPPRRRATRLAVARDQRRFPTVKGADGERTAADRAAANDAGDDDAVYLDEHGHVLEAANGAVVGWRGNTLCIPEARGRVLPSTTVATMVAHLDGWRPPGPQLPRSLAAERVVDSAEVSWHRFRPDEVDELWYVNALHGLTPVVAFDGHERSFEASRLAAWLETSRNWWEPAA